MKKVLILFCSFMVLLGNGCEHPEVNPDNPATDSDKPDTDIYQNSPASAIPDEFQDGTWFWGNTGSLSYYDYDGNNVGNDVEAGWQYRFKEVDGKGRLEFQQYLGMRNASNCVTEIYTHVRGTVKFEGPDKFTFYPVEGSIKTVKSGTAAACPQGTTEQALTPDKLTPTVVLYQMKIIDGEKLWYAYKDEDVNFSQPLFVYSQGN